jgi:hypothetical protein
VLITAPTPVMTEQPISAVPSSTSGRTDGV